MRLKPDKINFLAFTAFFAVLAAFVFWGAWGTCACPVMPDARMTFPVDGYVSSVIREWIKSGRFVPWDITSFIGSPYLYQELQYAVAVYFSALALAYYLKGRGLGDLASYGAGLFLGFSGYWLTLYSAGHAGWFRLAMVCVFAFGLVDRAVRKGKMKNFVLLGACVAWGGFYQPDLWLFFTLFTAVYFLWSCIREKKLPSWKGTLVSAVVFFVIASPSLKNAVNEKAGRDRQIEGFKSAAAAGVKKADDKEARWVFVTNWSLPPAETAEFFIPRLNGDTSCQSVLALGREQRTGVRPYSGALGRPINAVSGNYRQHSLYVGWVTCLLALGAVVFLFLRPRQETKDGVCGSNAKEIAFFACAAVIFWLLSLGRNFEPLYRIVFMLPIGDSIRAPVKWHHLTELCLCILAGYGLQAVRSRLVSAGFKEKTAALILGGAVVFGAFDLARVAKLYCSVIDLSVVKNDNRAADFIKERGGGKTADFITGGNSLLSWSFGVRGVGLTGDYNAEDVRFILAPLQSMNAPDMRRYIESKGAKAVATYSVTSRAVRESAGGRGNVVLLEVPSVPAKPRGKVPMPPVTIVTYLGALSLLGSLFAGAYAVKKS